MMKRNVLIVTGETSGDIHAASLIRSLKSLNPDIYFFGIGGKQMKAEGADLVEDIQKLSLIGVSEIFAKLRGIRSAFRKVLNKIEETPPDAVVLVDYPGFNLALAKALKKKGYRIIYYITPQVWAWGKSRVYHMKKYIDKAIVIFKFEEELLKKYGINATFVGHPLLDIVKRVGFPDKKSLGLDSARPIVALLPGSREAEVKRHLPAMLKTASIILKQKSVQFILLKNSGVEENIYAGILAKHDLPLTVMKDDTYGCLNNSDFIFTSSGTATLESALMGKPMVIIYKTSFLTALLFKIFARTPFIGLVNIIAGKRIVPEILQYDAKPKRLARELLSIISSSEKREAQQKELAKVKDSLGREGASLRAASIVNGLLG